MEERKPSVRIQTSILHGVEHKALVWLARRMPAWVTSDMLTFTGFAGALIIAAGYALTTKDIRWLWLACFGFAVNWFGDSLDGTLARVRGTQRPVYGFFVDHNVDCINETIMFIGVGMSVLMNLTIALIALVAYLLMSIYVYINAHLKDEFRISYAGLGPTEFRIVIVIVNILFIVIAPLREAAWDVALPGGWTVTLRVLDFIALAISAILYLIYLVSIFKDAKYYAGIDPPRDFKG